MLYQTITRKSATDKHMWLFVRVEHKLNNKHIVDLYPAKDYFEVGQILTNLQPTSDKTIMICTRKRLPRFSAKVEYRYYPHYNIDHLTGRYNGWANYATWDVNMWLSADEITYNNVIALLRDIEDSEEWALAIKEYVIDHNPLAYDSSMYSDLMSDQLNTVNWDEIAKAFKADWSW